jgi:hypothetical protein
MRLKRHIATLSVAAQIGSAARPLALEIDLDRSLRCANYTDQVPFWKPFPASNAASQRHVLAALL